MTLVEVEDASIRELGVFNTEHELSKKRLLEDTVELNSDKVWASIELLFDPPSEADAHVDCLSRNNTHTVSDGVDHGVDERVAVLDVASKSRFDDRQFQRMTSLELL
jgi:hypothetical protein